MSKPRIATVWLDGCSGCHMSLLDMDERLVEVVKAVELVFSPLMDAKEYPEDVDVVLIEGAVSSDEDLRLVQKIRRRTKKIVSLGDCAITGNVPSMRNPFDLRDVLRRAYCDTASSPERPRAPRRGLPVLLPRVRPVHEEIEVDFFVPGCPPPADAIHFVLSELLAGRVPDPSQLTRFGR